MPKYDMHCSNCDHRFEHSQSIKEPILKKCPQCEQETLNVVMGLPRVTVRLGDGEIKLGHLADRNRDRFSEDHKQSINSTYGIKPVKEKPWYWEDSDKTKKEIAAMTPEEQVNYVNGE